MKSKAFRTGRTNRYGGTCLVCKADVAEGEGELVEARVTEAGWTGHVVGQHLAWHVAHRAGTCQRPEAAAPVAPQRCTLYRADQGCPLHGETCRRAA